MPRVKVKVEPYRIINEALEEAARGWMLNDVHDSLGYAGKWGDDAVTWLEEESRLACLIEQLRHRFGCALEERGVRLT
jgi:hypothetical protein